MAFRFTLKKKLLLIASLLIASPFLVFQYIQELEVFLKQNLEQNLRLAARSLASGLHNRKDLSLQQPGIATRKESWLVLPLSDALMDGYDHEWERFKEYYYRYPSESDSNFALDVRVGQYKGYIQFFLTIVDSEISYPDLNSDIDQFDSVIIKTKRGTEIDYAIILPSGTGRTVVKSLTANGDIADSAASGIDAIWLQTEQGYQLELRVSKDISEIGFVVTDADNNQRPNRIRTSANGLNGLRIPSPAINDFFMRLRDMNGRRVWLLDRFGQVIVKQGDLVQTTNMKVYNPLVGWLMNHPNTKFIDPRFGKKHLNSAEVVAALGGDTASSWLNSGQGESILVSAAEPIYLDEAIVGVVVVDEASTHLLFAQRRTFINLLNIASLIFLALLLGLMLFAGRLNYRLRQLRDATETVIDNKGQLDGQFIVSGASDEVGDLTRSFATMVQRLHQYQDYLRKLASRLSHELRTPIAVIRSSLDNLKMQNLDPESKQTLARAEEGVLRLAKILTRMREASGVEDSIAHAEIETVSVHDFFSGLIAGYRSVYPNIEFELTFNAEDDRQFSIAPDLLAQAIDKLISNAVDFCSNNRVSTVVSYHDQLLAIAISNHGPIIPEADQQTIFESMVSMRANRQSDEPHLGLGLFVVRLVAEFHRGKVGVRNLSAPAGVEFSISIPL